MAPTDENPTATIAAHRQRYADYLARYDCVGDYVGEIVPRGTCRQPWFNQLDLSVRKRFAVTATQSAELSVDLFNVLNGINSDWGRNRTVSSSRRNLLIPQQFNQETQQIEYTVPADFGELRQVGTGLIQQFSAQLGVRYSF